MSDAIGKRRPSGTAAFLSTITRTSPIILSLSSKYNHKRLILISSMAYLYRHNVLIFYPLLFPSLKDINHPNASPILKIKTAPKR